MVRSFLLAGACAALCAGAHAEQRLVVSTAGFDLSAPGGAKAFYSRLSRAVAGACGGAPTAFLGSEEERFETCFKLAMDQAVAQAHAPLLSSLHIRKMGGAAAPRLRADLRP